MIHLVASGNYAPWGEIAARLRGVTIEPLDHSPDRPLPQCDGVLCCGAAAAALADGVRFLAEGKHVLLATDESLSSGVLDALLSKYGSGKLALVNPDRFLPSRRLIKQELDAGKLGPPGLVRIHRWETWAAGTRWPSGLLRDLDLALWLMGNPPDIVYALKQSLGESAAAAGKSLHVHLGFPGGGMALIDCVQSPAVGDGYQYLSLIGATGAAYADDHQNMQLVYRGGGRPEGVRAEEGIRQYVSLVQDFVDGLTTGRDFSASVAEWQGVLKVASAIEQSIASRQSVSLEVR